MSYETELMGVLQSCQEGTLTPEEALVQIRGLSCTDLGFACLDNSRSLRQGFPEVVYCEGKTVEQVVKIMQTLARQKVNVLGTRADKFKYEAVKAVLPQAEYDELSKLIMLEQDPLPRNPQHKIAVVTAGTSDLPIAEEAAKTAEIMGNEVLRVYDVGVAGLHRLLNRLDDIRSARVVIVIAGMEGALASVVGGLVAAPVLAVPTSVGYGANFKGLSALLGMLNSCSGVAVVNIDNGFGAGRMASIINHLR
jgi:NCAIR mutase (PurE)-related protein